MVHIIPKSGFARTYLIEEDEGLMAVDVGSIGAAQEIEVYCTQVLKKSLQDIRIITVTHFHIDHIGGIGTLLQKCSPETRVLFHPFVKEYLTGRREMSPMKNWLNGLIPTLIASCSDIGSLSHVAFETLAGIPLSAMKNCCCLPYEPWIHYFDTGRLPSYRFGFGDWEIIATPGHTEDSVSFYSDAAKELICGDLIIGRQDGSSQLNHFYWDEDLIKEAFKMLREIFSPRIIYPGHGDIIADDENAFRKVGIISRSG
ncbi:MAG TPA: MBL fold metallo-hydrolase [Syntrophales bacterium]|nr:MBL fold metallo-hydrolase [Syntrophales bacterium]HPL67417.1 MBL fold metallo-hydrolase [Smithellaceae bacterium]HPN08220.1 MBL fold metallo-hydrolase [Syntrophales bacterium]HPX82678.1 MBL fold metallo-hydrolase [Syntrophales bacterium]